MGCHLNIIYFAKQILDFFIKILINKRESYTYPIILILIHIIKIILLSNIQKVLIDYYLLKVIKKGFSRIIHK